jgi:hypothetical protein
MVRTETTGDLSPTFVRVLSSAAAIRWDSAEIMTRRMQIERPLGTLVLINSLNQKSVNVSMLNMLVDFQFDRSRHFWR